MEIIEYFIKFILSLFKRSSSKDDESKEEETLAEDNNNFEVYENVNELEEEEICMNNSKVDEFHKQTNNEIDPFISCFPTSMINAGEVVNVDFPKDEKKTHGYVQEEDQYNWYLENNEECKSFWNKPAYKNYLSDPKNHPRELWEVEEFCFNKWIGKPVCKFVPNIKIDKIIDVISNGGAVVTSGRFCGFGHVVCMVGLNKSGNDVKEFIVDDSYGNPHNKYKPVGVGGNDVVWEKDKFLAAINKGTSANPIYNAIIFEKA